MAQKRKSDQSKLIAEAALSHADKVGWDGLALKDVAKKAKLSLEVVTGIFPDTWALLLYVIQMLDAETLAAAEPDGNWRDGLFELLMTRFDLMETHRAAYLSLLPALLKHPQAAPKFLKPFYGSMRAMLEHANAPASPLHAAGFGALYLSLLDAWKNDETPDLSKTMAAADKRLEFFEKAAGALPCG